MKTHFITATCTPLGADESLHVEGLRAHLEDQWKSGISGLLVGGTMGLMQLQTDQTYRDLAAESVKATAGRGEVLIGVGDTSFARTRDRIRMVEHLEIDGIVSLAPYLIKFTQPELIDYYKALADIAKKPLYLYDLPQLTGTKIENETVLALCGHRNIGGIKCSGPVDGTIQLMQAVPKDFRVIVAQPMLVDMLLRNGVRDHLDGIFGIAPAWTVAIGRAAEQGNFEQAVQHQKRLSSLLHVVRKYGVFPACTAILNARGIPGRVAPAPMRLLPEDQREELLAEDIIRELIAGK